MSEFLFGDVVW